MNLFKVKNLWVRLASALGAVGLLVLLHHFFGLTGLILMALTLEVLVIKEGVGLVDWRPLGVVFKVGLGILIYVLFGILLLWEPYRFQVLGLSFTLILSGTLHLKILDDVKRLRDLQTQILAMSFYLAVLPAILVDLLLKYQGGLWFSSLLILVFSGDIGAYLLGVTLGKRHMLAHISPKKTWVGAIGGFFATLIAADLIHRWVGLEIPWLGWLSMAGLISIVAQSGDFFESLLKRVAQVKDSGALMPGHGGLLDRIDGLLFAAPVMSAAVTFFDPWIR